jgi:hypothetical protein
MSFWNGNYDHVSEKRDHLEVVYIFILEEIHDQGHKSQEVFTYMYIEVVMTTGFTDYCHINCIVALFLLNC